MSEAEKTQPRGIPRQALLQALYEAHAGLAAQRRTACEPGCSACCTDRAALTGLEAGLLAQGLRSGGREGLLRLAAGKGQPSAAQPAYTFNQLARLCLEQREPPAEPTAPLAQGACPLLQGGLCAAYQVRPFACRAMASQRPCGPGGAAEAQDWWVTLDTAFFQLIEHLDAGGVYGWLPAALAWTQGGPDQGLLTCQLLPGLPAPAEHQTLLRSALGPVLARPVQGRPLGQWLDLIRQGWQGPSVR
ncbi:MAG: hypothetical protein C4525_08390 [Desulfarculus sp.]|nr:MAG: hypothetical protein C4525_08390 [Desulfarculus sp.]